MNDVVDSRAVDNLLLSVLGPLTQYMTPTLDAALLICGSPGRGRTTSSRVGADLGRTSLYLRSHG